jgi:VWFA-related protein
VKASLVAAGLVVASAAALASQQIPVFRSEANYVEVTVRVVDRDGKFVEGLTAADFEVREDTHKERVENVFVVDLPTRWNPDASRTTVLYRQDMARDLKVAEGRVYLLFLNAVHAEHIAITRKLAREFVDNYLMPEDVVAIWSQAGGLVTFTNDKFRIHKAIDTFLGSSDAFTTGVPGTRDLGRIEPRITSALDWFSSVQGRKKSMLLFSAGWSGIGPVFSDRATTLSTQTDLVDRADMQIYIVDTRGLTTPSRHNILGANEPAFGSVRGTNFVSEAAELDHMRWLAEDTGGFAIVNHNTYQNSFRRIVEENSTYYVLGYQSSAKARRNWDFRGIQVKVIKPGLSDVRVQARKGYIAR